MKTLGEKQATSMVEGAGQGTDPLLAVLQRAAVGVVTAFAAWTVFCHLFVLSTASFDSLLAWAWLGLLLSVLAGLAMARSSAAALDQCVLPNLQERAVFLGDRWWLVMLVSGLLVVAYRLSGNYQLFWVALVCLLAVAAFFLKRQGGESYPVSIRPVHGSYIVLLCSLLLVLYVLLHDAQNLDDPLYLNLIVGLLDYPDLPMLRWDTLHNIDGLEIVNAAYATKSLEPLQAVLAGYFGLDFLSLRQFVFAPLSAVLSVVFIALTLRHVSPDQWPYALLSCLLLIFIWAVDFRMMGGFYFNYLSIGKQVLVAVIVPALSWQSMRWFALRRPMDWVLLAILNIAAVGLSPNGIYVAPLTVGLLSLAYLRLDVEGVKAVLLSYAACFYPVVTGLVLIVQGDVAASEVTEFIPIDASLRSSLGWDWRYWFLLLMLPAGWVFFRSKAQQRLMVVWVLAFVAIIGNPWLNTLWADHVTGNLNWRLTWAFPLLILLALFLHAFAGRLSRKKALVPVGLLMLTLFGGNESALGPSSWDEFSGLQLKVPGEEYRLAGNFVEQLEPKSVVLAPKQLAAYVLTYRRHPQVLVSRPLYLFHYRDRLPLCELTRRLLLYGLVSPLEETGGALDRLRRFARERGVPDELLSVDHALGLLDEALATGDIDALVFRAGGQHASALNGLAAGHGFGAREFETDSGDDYRVMVRLGGGRDGAALQRPRLRAMCRALEGLNGGSVAGDRVD